MHTKRYVTLLALCVVAAGALSSGALAAGSTAEPTEPTEPTELTEPTADQASGETVRVGSQSVAVRGLVMNVSNLQLNGTGLPPQEIDRAHYTVQNAQFRTDGFTVRYGDTTYNVGAIDVSVDDVGLVLRNVVIADGGSRSDGASSANGDSSSDDEQSAEGSATGEDEDGDATEGGADTGDDAESGGDDASSAGETTEDAADDTNAFLDVSVACGVDGAEITITNVGDAPVESRDLDVTGRSQDVIDGRPVLSPGESMMLVPVSDGRVEIQAFAPGSVGDAVGPVHVRNVDCTPS